MIPDCHIESTRGKPSLPGETLTEQRPGTEPGTPRSFADLRGGPAAVAGVDYQILVTLYQTLALLREARLDSATPSQVRPELREPVPGGQLGYDFGWTGSRQFPPERWEIKLTPARVDVNEFLDRAAAGAAQGIEGRSCLVAGNRTAAVNQLDRLVRLVGEATDLGHFRSLIEHAGDRGLEGLVDRLGGNPLTVRATVWQPWVIDPRSLAQQVDFHCRELALPGQAAALREQVEAELREASRSRAAIPMATLARRLQERRILGPPAQADISMEDPEMLAALVVLQRCPAPLPKEVVAEGLDVTTGRLEELLAAHRVLGWVSWDADRVAAQPMGGPLPQPGGVERVYRRTLETLQREYREHPAGPEQVPNVFELGRAVLDEDPALVARLFETFDKASKAYGNLGLVQELARLSTDAVRQVAEGVRSDDERAALMALLARNHICGEAWVLQRVNELDDAEGFLAEARRLNEQSGDRTGLAFVDKCSGRLTRMRAERANPTDRPALLAHSKALLGDAAEAFRELAAHNHALREDAGESLSLLARTLAVEGALEAARRTCAEAHQDLDLFAHGKAYADLTLLEAEIALRVYEDASGEADPDPGELEAHLARAESVVTGHQAVGPPDQRRSTSEVAARAHLVVGRIQATLGDPEVAERHFREAERLYRELDYFDAMWEASWEAVQVSGAEIPCELLDALERANADGVTRAVAYDELKLWRDRQESAKMSGPSDFPADEGWWNTMVRRAEDRVVLQRPSWAMRRSTA